MPADGSLGYFQFFRITFSVHNSSRHITYKLKHSFSFSHLRNLSSALLTINRATHLVIECG